MRSIQRVFLASLLLVGFPIIAAGHFEADDPPVKKVLVLLKEQASLRGVGDDHRRVEERLQAVAARRDRNLRPGSIQSLVSHLEQRGEITGVEGYWIINAYTFTASPQALESVRRHPAVRTVDSFPEALSLNDPEEPTPLEPATWGVEAIGAPEAWNLGYKGEGVSVGIIDTGIALKPLDYDGDGVVDAGHPALASKLATIQQGLDAGKPAFFNSYLVSAPTEETNDSHGTHVAGILVGGKGVGGSKPIDPNQAIGIAPEAELYFAQKINVISALQWMADPDGLPETNDYPIVINNSWISSFSDALTQVLDNLDALGITLVFSAGNSGYSGPYSVREIHRYPLLLLACNSMEGTPPEVNPGSSRGPAVYLGEEFIKPDLCAPGTNILSSVYPGSYKDMEPNVGSATAIYKFLSGTSMSAPMVSGASVLVQQAYHEAEAKWLSPDKVKSILQFSSQSMTANENETMGQPDLGKDIVSGSGLINIPAALVLTLNHGTIQGVVKNSVGAPVPFVRISLLYKGLNYEFYSNRFGEYELALPPIEDPVAEPYTIQFAKKGHESVSLKAMVQGEAVMTQDVTLPSQPVYLSFAPGLLTFYAALGGSALQQFEVYNHGHDPLVIESIQTDNTKFTISTPEDKSFEPIMISPFQSTSVTVIYTPTEVMEDQANLSFVSNASNGAEVPSLQLLGFANDAFFSDVAVQAGVEDPNKGKGQGLGSDAEIIWSDLNGDNQEDLVLPGFSYEFMMAFNQGDGSFQMSQDLNGLGDLTDDKVNVDVFLTADMDNDGDQDVVIRLYDSQAGNVKILIRFNNGEGYFDSGLILKKGANLSSLGITDINNDGLLDVVFINAGELGLLRQGLLHYFTEEPLVIDTPGVNITHKDIYPIDYDNDGYTDLIFETPMAESDNNIPLLRNNQSGGFYLVQNLGEFSSADLAFADYDNDGDMDIYLQVREPLKEGDFAVDLILVNQANLDPTVPFIPVASPYQPTSKTHLGAGPVNWIDYNNDGAFDFFFTFGSKGLNRLFEDSGNHIDYQEVAPLLGIQGNLSVEGSEYGSGWADFDNDGDLDAYITRTKWYNALYRNNLYEKGGEVHWLEVTLMGIQSNRDGLGSRLLLKTKIDSRLRELLIADHAEGQSSKRVHFGLGGLTSGEIEGLTIYWPSGQVQNVSLEQVNQHITVVEGLGVCGSQVNCEADQDEDGVVDLLDNCPQNTNTDQKDSDGDGKGNLCDATLECPSGWLPVEGDCLKDSDLDGFADTQDNCPKHANTDQKDSDGDGQGNECDWDDDGDEIDDWWDNCPDVANLDQKDGDDDWIGDACDDDWDNDGVKNEMDNCPKTVNPDQADSDNDKVGEACEVDEKLMKWIKKCFFNYKSQYNLECMPIKSLFDANKLKLEKPKSPFWHSK